VVVVGMSVVAAVVVVGMSVVVVVAGRMAEVAGKTVVVVALVALLVAVLVAVWLVEHFPG